MRYVELDGKRYEWKEIRRIRREQIQAALKPQLTLFELRHDSRPPSQQTASGRYQQPLLFKE